MVRHFLGRGTFGKAMFISIDRLTAVKMYDKVRKYWAAAVSIPWRTLPLRHALMAAKLTNVIWQMTLPRPSLSPGP